MAGARQPTLLWALLGLDGRVSREVFWLGNFGCGFIGVALLMPSLDPDTGALVLAPTSPVVFAALLWTEVALAVKRLHDRNLTGWYAAAFGIPVLGLAAFFVIGLLPGDRGANKYGPATNTRGPV
ncbi:DUF805 domain-containing protein [Acuticoccus sp. MNP-M23]|uniref:DUF805 domain-containing protein n=1 Tax=Acuticoccus sp. MNP-M23 TaxID=3072793 RepID=UPI002815B32F|nr:DUF805 domain-containing protein [Acuticoccus sp. MNP-M23]WMS43610.1 DUF805 domain-containing protein [Acuticoccus sp. MNP-M23]